MVAPALQLRTRRRAAGALAAVSAAGLSLLAFPPAGLGVLAVVMLAPLVAAAEGLRARQGFALFYAYSLLLGLGIARWLVVPLVREYGLPALPAWSFSVLLVAAYALVPAAGGALYCALRPGVPIAVAPLVFAAAHALAEWLRAEPLGLPWVLAAQPLAGHPVALQTADVGGVYAVGFLVAAQNAGLGLALRRRRAAPLALPAALTAVAIGYAAARLVVAGEPHGETARIGVVQAAVPQAERFTADSAERNVRRHAALTRELVARERAAGHPLDLVVWSETAVDVDLDARADLLRSLARLVDEIGVPLVSGAPRSAGGRLTNAVILLQPGTGLVESYDKQRLVPFAESDTWLAPLVAPLIGPVLAGDPYAPGREATVFERAPIPLSAPICFEITYPPLVRRFRTEGARLVLNLSNDAWFARTGYAELHFAHAIFRAIETRAWVVRAANTGVSGVIDPAGRVAARLPELAQGTLAADVHAAGPLPPYTRTGDAPVVTALLAVLAASTTGRRRRAPR